MFSFKNHTKTRQRLALLLAVLVPGFSFFFRIEFLDNLGATVAYITFYPAVLLVAIYGGLIPGTLATLISAFLSTYWNKPLGKFGIYDSADWLPISVFMFSCTMIAIIADRMLLAQSRLEQNRKELVEARDQAQAANHAKSAFLANMSHELRTPLNAVLGYSQLMRRDLSLSADHQQYLDIINCSGAHLLELINDVLEISKIEAQTPTLEVSAFNLHRLLQDLIDMFRAKTQLKSLTFETAGLHNIPQYILGDRRKIKAVLINLLGNAVKFTDKGMVALKVTYSSNAKSSGTLQFHVADTGFGISEEEVCKLFRYFEQTESGRSLNSGTGLGLALSQEHAKLMGGEILVKSRLGEGSTFTLDIPVEICSGAQVVSDQAITHSPMRLPEGTTYPVLIADDTEENLQLLDQILKNAGFETRLARNGQEVVDITEIWYPKVILMDIRMPVLDGLEATRIIKARFGSESPVIIAVTAHVIQSEIQAILNAGCDAVVHKPYQDHEILSLIGQRLGISEDPCSPSPEPLVTSSPLSLKDIPESIRDRLKDYITHLDIEGTHQTIEALYGSHPDVASRLHLLAREMDYSEIYRLLDDPAVKEV